MADEHDRPGESPQELGQVGGVAGEIAKWVAETDGGVSALTEGAEWLEKVTDEQYGASKEQRR